MRFLAHKTEKGKGQLLSEHLNSTAKLCEEFSTDGLKEYAYLCGLMHDIGKYTATFQRRINGENIRVQHAISGALEINKNAKGTSYAPLLEYCIAGHHTGLPDGGHKGDIDSTLCALLGKKTEDYSAFADEIAPHYPNNNLITLFGECETKEEIIELYSFLTRYMYSCLTDADFLDTENFFAPETDRELKGDFKAAYQKVCNTLNGCKRNATTKLQKARNGLQEQVYECMDKPAQIYFVDMPTGSGKTLCSIKSALKKAIQLGKKRIIYVIPYVSIIEQTANLFRDIFDKTLTVVEHHSNYSFDDKADTTEEKLKKACENWDAPLIVTTNIQFFESVYHHKSSRLRKLHNMADSIIVFDEIHMLPPEYIYPCMRAISYITKYLNSEAIIMSATMPDYNAIMPECFKANTVKFTPFDKTDFVLFKKCAYSFIGKRAIEELADDICNKKSVLAVVNRRAYARELYNRVKSDFDGNVYHLSTYMTPEHRTRVIKKIKESLGKKEKTAVISTSLIEAGVDLDFETVYRENAGIDNIIQSGGRCNREGGKDNADVFVFETEEIIKPLRLKANITRALFEEFESIDNEDCIKEYYRRLFAADDDILRTKTITALMNDCLRIDTIPFRSYSERFNFIESESYAVVIPCDENKELLPKLKYGGLSAKRDLQKYSASVYGYELDELRKMGVVEEIGDVFVLAVNDYYSEEYGLDKNKIINTII